MDREDVLVGSLFEGKNSTALAYIRQLFGATRRVETEEELERYSRALTVDGMLSANGGTRALRLPSAHQLLLGAQSARDHEREAKQHLQESLAAFAQAQQRFNALNDLHRDHVALRDPSAGVRYGFTRLEEVVASHGEAQARLSRLDRAQIDSLRARRDEIKRQRGELAQARDDAKELVTRLTTDISNTTERVAQLKIQAGALKSRQMELFTHLDFDPQLLSEQRERFDQASFDSMTARIEKCRKEAEQARQRADAHVTDVMPEFVRYTDLHGAPVLEERSDWRAAQRWVTEEVTRLKDSQLVQYREQAELARAAAEEAFRKDIAIRLRENIQRMKNNLKALDKILSCCPPFSNGERYQFEAKPAENHKALYQYIMNAAEAEQEGLFAVQDPVQFKIVELLEEHASGEAPRGSNPLEDYRLLFTFDLLIQRDGETISRLSKRIGSGSNGEHRTPFYVIAGAALAAAYRIQPGKKPDGAALMLLDEAFYGMDPQNAIAAAEFLDAIGLQLVMAAPESDYGKLASLCQSVFDIARDDLEAYIEPTQMKEDATKLLQSDLHFKHPHLLELALAQVQ